MKNSFLEANYVKRGDKLENQDTYEGNYCMSLCMHHKIINIDTPDSCSICTLHNIRVDAYDSCDYYRSIFDDDPDLLKPFIVADSAKKKKNWFLRLLSRIP